jgi:hypothetical protein
VFLPGGWFWSFILGNLRAQRLRAALHLPGFHRHAASSFSNWLPSSKLTIAPTAAIMRVTAGESEALSKPTGRVGKTLARRRGNESRPPAALTGRERSRLLAPPGVAAYPTAFEACLRWVLAGMIGIGPALHGPPNELQHSTTSRGPQIKFGHALPPQERIDIPQDLSGEQAFERGFFYCPPREPAGLLPQLEIADRLRDRNQLVNQLTESVILIDLFVGGPPSTGKPEIAAPEDRSIDPPRALLAE